MNRKQRRATAASKGQGKDLRLAMAKVQGSLATLSASNLDQLPKVIWELQEQTKRASLLADALSDDYVTLLRRLDILEILLQGILGSSFEAAFKQAEDALNTPPAEALRADEPCQ
jgi:hypothetical protein